MNSVLPIDPVLPELRRHLAGHNTLVLQAPPGAGKTTRVPMALLDEPWLAGRSILMLEPRRLAARAAAARMAGELGERIGETVGYRVRFDSQVSERTRIEVLTEGILSRRLQGDPELEGVGLVIFDEFHERHLHGDLALALCLDVTKALREDLRIMLMSATLDGEAVAGFLSAPLVTSAGRSHPVDVRYLPRDPDGPIADTVARAVVRALGEEEGDLLVFLPGAGEIKGAQRLLASEPACAGVMIHGLYGDLPLDEQQRAIQPDRSGQRRVVLATPIAETSLTIEGVRVVVDGGWCRVPRFDPRSALTRLDTVRVSRASADQRAGRAGRLGPGVCYRLWSEATQRGLRPQGDPEIREADLASLALELALWGANDAISLDWLDPPPEGALAQARSLLGELGALDEGGRITPMGRAMAALSAHPRLAHMLLAAQRLGFGPLACDMAALLSERDLLRGGDRSESDFGLRIEALRAFRRQGREAARRYGADPGACGAVERAARQWRRRLDCGADDSSPQDERVGLLLALAYPDRIARRREGGQGRYRLSGGRGARLAPACPLAAHEWLVAANVDGRGQEGLIRLAAPLSPEQLREHQGNRIQWRDEVRWDERAEAVIARREERLGALVLDERPLEGGEGTQVIAAMVEGVRTLGLGALPWTEAARELQARALSLRHWFPGEDWPDLGDEALAATLGDWLTPYLTGITRREHLSRLHLETVLKGMLSWEQRRRLEEGAPTHLPVPSGARRRLRYTPGEPPVLAVKLQEMFGQADTPTVGWGRVPVTLHLLSPARRPIQVTQDLRGFWERTYPEVKKELKGRYPKHPWPEDPWTAQPTAAAKRRTGKR